MIYNTMSFSFNHMCLCPKATNERDARMYGCINDLASGYGNFCTDCKSRKVSDACFNCLKMFREKVKAKCEEAKSYRNHGGGSSPHASGGGGRFSGTPTDVKKFDLTTEQWMWHSDASYVRLKRTHSEVKCL